MHLSALLRVLWLAFLASVAIGSPVPGKNGGSSTSSSSSDSDDNDIAQTDPAAISSGIMRFGIELKTVIKINPKTSHPELVKMFEAYRLAESQKKIESAYSAIEAEIRKFLVDQWTEYNPSKDGKKPTGNPWLDNAAHLAKVDPIYMEHTLSKPELVDRTPGTPGSVASKKKAYKTWSITYDSTIKYRGEKYEYPFEFVSPVLLIGSSDYWYFRARYQVEFFFRFLTSHCGFDIVQTRSASTHVHVSPYVEESRAKSGDDGWTDERVRRVASAAVFFEPAIRSLLPRDRWANWDAEEWRNPSYQSHWNVPGFASGTKQDTKEATLGVVAKIEELDTMQKVHQYMNFDNGLGPLEKDGLTTRFWGWNFGNIKDISRHGTSIGSIEFRRGAQSTSASDAMFNIELAVAFTLAACTHGRSSVLKDNFDLKRSSLKNFIYYNWPTPPKQVGGTGLKTSFYQAYQRQPRFFYPELEKKFNSPGLAKYDPTRMKVDYNSETNLPMKSQSLDNDIGDDAFSNSDSDGYFAGSGEDSEEEEKREWDDLSPEEQDTFMKTAEDFLLAAVEALLDV